MAFMPEHAPLVALRFLGTTALLGLAAVVFVFAAVLKHKWLALGAAAVALLAATTYTLIVVGVSLVSHRLGCSERLSRR